MIICALVKDELMHICAPVLKSVTVFSTLLLSKQPKIGVCNAYKK